MNEVIIYISKCVFYPKLDIGGIIVCDDYNISAYSGAKDAWDEYS